MFQSSEFRFNLRLALREYGAKGISDQDDSHLEEWMTKVMTPSLAPHYSDIQESDFVKTGTIHHHVWITEDIAELLKHAGMRVLYMNDEVPDRRDSFVVVAEKI